MTVNVLLGSLLWAVSVAGIIFSFCIVKSFKSCLLSAHERKKKETGRKEERKRTLTDGGMIMSRDLHTVRH